MVLSPLLKGDFTGRRGGGGVGPEKLVNKVLNLEKLVIKDTFGGFGSPQAEIFEDFGGVLHQKHVPECTPAT